MVKKEIPNEMLQQFNATVANKNIIATLSVKKTAVNFSR